VNELELGLHWLRGRQTLPRYLILGMTNLCNSKCVTCFYWDHLNVNRHLEMTLEEYDRALADLPSLYSVVLTGGEPTLNRELPDVTRILYRRHDASNVTMPTNSLIPDQVEAIVAKALESRKDDRQTFTVGLSLDHLGERHDQIRGAPGNFPRVGETYERLIRLKRRFRGLTVNVQTVLASFNRDDLPEITSWVGANFPAIDFHSFELLRPPFPDPSIRALTAEEYREALKFLKPYWAGFDRYRPILRNLKVAAREAELETLSQERMVYKCYAGTISGVLNPEGTVSLCEVQWEIGNIRDFGYSFAKAWFSEKARELRARVARRECWCTHSCFMTSSLPFSVRGAAHLATTALSLSRMDRAEPTPPVRPSEL
jgi:MoaA/NifB/PqqE/SkfB family radical SAM enzyme